MSSNHQALPEKTLMHAVSEMERVVNFIDRFTAMVVQKLEKLEKQMAGRAPSSATSKGI
jgi:hypothetical protein